MTKRLKSLVDIIKKARDRGFLDEKHCKIVDNFRVLRNYYVHFVNQAEYFNELYQNAVELAKNHLEIREERENALKILNEFHRLHTQTKFMGLRWGRIRANETRRFLDRNEKRYQEWCDNNRYSILELTDFKRARHFSIHRFNALSSIKWTSKILRKLEKNISLSKGPSTN